MATHLCMVTMLALLGPGPGAAEASALPPRLGFTDDQVLLVDGKPFLPIGLYHPWHQQLEPDALAEITGQRFNLLEFWGGNLEQMQRFFDAAAAHGLKVFSSGATVIEDKKFVSLQPDVIERFRTHPALLCWVFQDEPIGREIPAGELRKAYQALKQVDPHHLVYLCDWWTGRYAEYADATDLFAADIYPIGHRPISLVREQLTEAQAVTGRKKPVWMVVQGHSFPPVLRQPTPGELECMVFLALASGAKGILYYDFASLRSNQALWDKVGVLNRHLARLAPIILAPTSPAKVPLAPPDAPIATMVKAHAGDTFIFVVNTSGETLPIKMTLLGLAKEAQVTELLSNGQPQVSDNGMVDTLPPLGVRVYRIASFAFAGLAWGAGKISSPTAPSRPWKLMASRPSGAATGPIDLHSAPPASDEDQGSPVDHDVVGGKDLHSLWYGVRVPAETSPGLYSGTLTVAPEAQPEAVLPVRLEVGAPVPLALLPAGRRTVQRSFSS